MKRAAKTAIILLVCLALLIGIACGFSFASRQDNNRESEISRHYSEDGQYCLIIYQVGEPVWSFSPAYCRLELLQNQKTISSKGIELNCDGANAGPANFTVLWYADKVGISTRGEERPSQSCFLYYDGTAD